MFVDLILIAIIDLLAIMINELLYVLIPTSQNHNQSKKKCGYALGIMVTKRSTNDVIIGAICKGPG
jgi:hypothetical protein